jgi:division protein CdvB (Snf7/Vps24/ESCRT-III family)
MPSILPEVDTALPTAVVRAAAVYEEERRAIEVAEVAEDELLRILGRLQASELLYRRR